MKKLLIILSAILICLSFSTDLSAQSRKKAKSGYNYKAHAKSNKAHAKTNAKRFKSSGGDLTKMKCNRSKSKARRRR